MSIEQHYSVAEVATLLGVSERSVWNYIEQGERSRGVDGIHPIVKLSHKAVRIPARAVNRFLKSRTVSAREPAAAEAKA